ncbi:MAG: site-specific integrase [Solobacterium sp.]|nr:site-specific integrase [Solobacterium sp.]
MAIYKDEKRNTWYVSVNVKNPETGKWSKTTKRGFKTKREAKTWENAVVEVHAVPAQPEDPQEPERKKLTFRDVNQRHLDYKHSKPATRRQEEYRMDTYFADHVNRPIDEITKDDLVVWSSALDKMELSTQVKNFMIYAVKGTFKFALEVLEVIEKNPSIILKKFKKTQEENTKEMEVWELDEFNQFIKNVDDPTYQAYFSFLYWTGCRRSEGLAVCASDFSGDSVRIWHSIKYIENGFQPLKNDSSIRTIKLDARLMQQLQPFLDQCDEDHPFLFGGDRSLPITNVQRNFNKAIKKAGVKKIRIHDLRHSHASLLINNGVNIVAVSKRLGHSDIQQTLATYTHLLQKTDAAMMEIISGLHS